MLNLLTTSRDLQMITYCKKFCALKYMFLDENQKIVIQNIKTKDFYLKIA